MSHRFLPHTADIRIEVLAPSLESLLKECVLVVRELVAGPAHVEDRLRVDLSIAASGAPDLIWQVTRLALDRFNTEAIIPSRLEIAAATPDGLKGLLWGELAEPDRHPAQPEVKALTRHDFVVESSPGGWRAELLFDV